MIWKQNLVMQLYYFIALIFSVLLHKKGKLPSRYSTTVELQQASV